MLKCLYHKEAHISQLLPVHFQEPIQRILILVLILLSKLLLFRLVNCESWNIGCRWWIVDDLSCLDWCPLVSGAIVSIKNLEIQGTSYLLSQTLMPKRIEVTARTFHPIFLRLSASGSAAQLRNSATSFAICEVVAGVSSSYSTNPS
jgi:hypothetical protein